MPDERDRHNGLCFVEHIQHSYIPHGTAEVHDHPRSHTNRSVRPFNPGSPLTINIENESSLFRSNSIYNRFLSAFAKIQGYNYLRQLILPIVKSMADLPAGQGYELDPSKANGQNLDQNQSNVQFLTTKFLELIFASRAGLPPFVLFQSTPARF